MSKEKVLNMSSQARQGDVFNVKINMSAEQFHALKGTKVKPTNGYLLVREGEGDHCHALNPDKAETISLGEKNGIEALITLVKEDTYLKHISPSTTVKSFDKQAWSKEHDSIGFKKGDVIRHTTQRRGQNLNELYRVTD
jgi:hypothetical protein